MCTVMTCMDVLHDVMQEFVWRTKLGSPFSWSADRRCCQRKASFKPSSTDI